MKSRSGREPRRDADEVHVVFNNKAATSRREQRNGCASVSANCSAACRVPRSKARCYKRGSAGWCVRRASPYLTWPLTSLVISNMLTLALPSKTALSLSSH